MSTVKGPLLKLTLTISHVTEGRFKGGIGAQGLNPKPFRCGPSTNSAFSGEESHFVSWDVGLWHEVRVSGI